MLIHNVMKNVFTFSHIQFNNSNFLYSDIYIDFHSIPMNTICKMVGGHGVTPCHHQHSVLRSPDALHLTSIYIGILQWADI